LRSPEVIQVAKEDLTARPVNGDSLMIEKRTESPPLPHLAVCLTFFYVPKRLPYLAKVISNYIGLASKTDIFIVTNIADTDRISKALPHLPGQMSLKFVTPQGIGHPYLLTWTHREILRTLLHSSDISHFLYSEDDLAFTRSNVIYWLRYRDPLRTHGFIPSFFRVELNQERGWCSTDCVSPIYLCRQRKVTLDDGAQFICMPNPYQGMYFLDRELMEEYVVSLAMSPDFGEWDIREKAAQGLTFVNVPKGYTSRNMVLIDAQMKTIAEECWIHHLPNSYASNNSTLSGKLPVKGNGVFVTGLLPYRWRQRGWRGSIMFGCDLLLPYGWRGEARKLLVHFNSKLKSGR
jgi:hypothetical protein